MSAAHDEAGDTAIALVMLCAETRQAGALASTLQRVGLDAEILYDPEVVDLHVAPHWLPILEARTWSARGQWSEQEGDYAYGPERWARTVQRLSSAVHLDISPDLTPQQVELVADALREACQQHRVASRGGRW